MSFSHSRLSSRFFVEPDYCLICERYDRCPQEELHAFACGGDRQKYHASCRLEWNSLYRTSAPFCPRCLGTICDTGDDADADNEALLSATSIVVRCGSSSDGNSDDSDDDNSYGGMSFQQQFSDDDDGFGEEEEDG